MDIKTVRDFFKKDRYLMLTDVEIDEVGEDSAICSFEIQDKHLNAADVVQGGATYTLADSAFAVASNIGHLVKGEKKLSVNQSANISYMNPPKGKKLIAKASKISGGRKMSVYKIEIYDEINTKIALMIGNAYTIDLK